MADIKYISLDNFNLYDELIKNYINVNDAKSIKTVSIDGNTLKFWNVSEPVGTTEPVYTIELPEPDLNALMSKVSSATDGNIGTFENGSMVDSGVAISDVATKTYVDETVAQKVLETSHMTKQIVTTVPTASEAKENVIYLLKVEDAEGADKYEEYMLISGQVVMIGDTSTDLTDYYTKEQTQSIIDQAEEDAVATAAADATTKANQALEDSKDYTNVEVGKVSATVTENTKSITTINNTLTEVDTTLTTHGDRISALESGMPEIAVATEEDIRAMFATTTE